MTWLELVPKQRHHHTWDLKALQLNFVQRFDSSDSGFGDSSVQWFHQFGTRNCKTLHWNQRWQKAKAQSTQDARRDAKRMGPVDVNGSVHTARKQHQRIWVRICVRASCVDWATAFPPCLKDFSFKIILRSGTNAKHLIYDSQGQAPCSKVWAPHHQHRNRHVPQKSSGIKVDEDCHTAYAFSCATKATEHQTPNGMFLLYESQICSFHIVCSARDKNKSLCSLWISSILQQDVSDVPAFKTWFHFGCLSKEQHEALLDGRVTTFPLASASFHLVKNDKSDLKCQANHCFEIKTRTTQNHRQQKMLQMSWMLRFSAVSFLSVAAV